MGITVDDITPAAIDNTFGSDPGKRRKAEFALELAAAFAARNDDGATVHVPDHIGGLFDFLYKPHISEDVPGRGRGTPRPEPVPENVVSHGLFGSGREDPRRRCLRCSGAATRAGPSLRLHLGC
jgi:hypothetical protein